LSEPSLIHEPDGGDTEVNLQVAEDGLYIFDRDGRRLHSWPYAELMDTGRARAVAQNRRPDVTLIMGNALTYREIAQRAPQLPQPPERDSMTERRADGLSETPISGRTFLLVLLGMLALSALYSFLG
jgi:hypothetical protein